MKIGSDNKLVRDSTQLKIGSFTFLTSIQVSNSDQNQIDFLKNRIAKSNDKSNAIRNIDLILIGTT